MALFAFMAFFAIQGFQKFSDMIAIGAFVLINRHFKNPPYKNKNRNAKISILSEKLIPPPEEISPVVRGIIRFGEVIPA